MIKTVAIPKELTQHSLFYTLLGCAYTILLWAGASFAIGYLWEYGILSQTPRVLVSLGLAVIGGYGILLAGFMGHDGTHFNLHDNRIVSSVIGILMTAPIFTYLLMGFTISHWAHHKNTNTNLDPDAVLFSKFKSFWSRLLFARPYTFLEYGMTCFRLAFGIPQPFEYTFPLSGNTVKALAWFNIIANAVMFVAFVAMFAAFPVYGLATSAVLLSGSMISGLSPYVEHTGTGLGRGSDTRTSLGRWWDVFMLGNNYHLEHHLYPTVPFYNLRAAYRHLKANGYYEEPRYVSNGIIDYYRYALGKFVYPIHSK